MRTPFFVDSHTIPMLPMRCIALLCSTLHYTLYILANPEEQT